MHADPNIEEDV